MWAIENSVSIDLLILERGTLLSGQVRISLIPQVIFVSLQIILFRFLLLIEFFLVLGISLIKGTLKLAKTVGEVDEDIGATDLHKGFVSGLQENHKLLVHMPEYMVTQYQIDSFPVLSYHALLIEVDVITLKEGGVLPI